MAARARVRRAAMLVSRRTRVIREFLDLYAGQAGTSRVLEKYPFTYYRFEEIALAAPSARFIFLVRHPCDVFASLVRRARVELREHIAIGQVSWMLLSADAFAQDWLWALGAGQSFARRTPDRVLLVRYEDLTEKPTRVLPEIAAFAGVDAQELIADDPQDPDPRRRFPLSSATPVANAGRYLDEVADADLAIIRARCADALAGLRYQALWRQSRGCLGPEPRWRRPSSTATARRAMRCDRAPRSAPRTGTPPCSSRGVSSLGDRGCCGRGAAMKRGSAPSGACGPTASLTSAPRWR
jgi:hypothetical protein